MLALFLSILALAAHAQSYSERTADSSAITNVSGGVAAADRCVNMTGIQKVVPPNMTADAFNVCTCNAGFTWNASLSLCDPTDRCLNFVGVQAAVPPNATRDGSTGNCMCNTGFTESGGACVVASCAVAGTSSTQYCATGLTGAYTLTVNYGASSANDLSITTVPTVGAPATNVVAAGGTAILHAGSPCGTGNFSHAINVASCTADACQLRCQMRCAGVMYDLNTPFTVANRCP